MPSQRILREVACDIVVNRLFFEHENFMMLLNNCAVSVQKHSLVEIVAALDLFGPHVLDSEQKPCCAPTYKVSSKKKTSAETVGQHPQREKKAITFTLNAGALTFAFLHTIGRVLECTRCVQFTTVRHVQRRQASSPRKRQSVQARHQLALFEM